MNTEIQPSGPGSPFFNNKIHSGLNVMNQPTRRNYAHKDYHQYQSRQLQRFAL